MTTARLLALSPYSQRKSDPPAAADFLGADTVRFKYCLIIFGVTVEHDGLAGAVVEAEAETPMPPAKAPALNDAQSNVEINARRANETVRIYCILPSRSAANRLAVRQPPLWEPRSYLGVRGVFPRLRPPMDRDLAEMHRSKVGGAAAGSTEALGQPP